MDGANSKNLILFVVSSVLLTLLSTPLGAGGTQTQLPQTPLEATRPTTVVDAGITIYVAHWRNDVRRGYAWAVGNTSGKVLWSSPASPGRKQGWTPQGTFAVNRVHERGFARRTNEPLPYFIRLAETSRGIHAYHSVPDYPASSGCIRVPLANAKALWELTGPYRETASDGGRTWSTKRGSITIVVLDTRRDALRERQAPAVTEALSR